MSKVSICIPVYNRADFIMEAVNSALDQDQPDLEINIVDNCSDDGTWEILNKITDPRVRIFRNDTNIGGWGNFTRSCEVSTGDLIVILCSDDRLRPGFLKHAAALMEQNPDATLLTSVGQFIDAEGNELERAFDSVAPGLYRGSSARRGYFHHMANYWISIFNFPPGIMLRRSACFAELPFRKEIGVSGDVDFWFRCLDHGDLVVTDFVGCDLRRHGQQWGIISLKNGEYFPQQMAFARAALQGTNASSLLDRYLYILGGRAFQSIVRGALEGRTEAFGLIPKYGWKWSAVVMAYVEIVVMRRIRLITKNYRTVLEKIDSRDRNGAAHPRRGSR